MTDNALEIGADLALLLGDNEREAQLRWAVLANSSPIAVVTVGDSTATIQFENGALLSFRDTGQSCCEQRYLTCDDDLASVRGGYLRRIEFVSGQHADEEYGDVHEQMFMKVRTTEGDFTVTAHNEHNGYYGGISLDAEWEEPRGVS